MTWNMAVFKLLIKDLALAKGLLITRNAMIAYSQ
jgi:hypothetical protein